MEDNIIRVGSGTNVSQLAGSIVETVKKNSTGLKIRSIGAGALNQAIKAVAVANRTLVSSKGIILSVVPNFEETEDGKTAISLVVKIHSV
jgi:stage V sporulation protein S